MEQQYSFKELYNLTLKATSPMKIGNRLFEEGEIVTQFDRIQVAGLKDKTISSTAKGGKGNRDLITWEKTKEVQLAFNQGVFSTEQFALMNNAQMVEYIEGAEVSKRETVIADDNGIVTLAHEPFKKVFVYDQKTYAKVTNFQVRAVTITNLSPYKKYIVDYTYVQKGLAESVLIGRHLFDGYFKAEGRTRIKDDQTGLIRTGIFYIPKLKLVSNLSVTMGTNNSPVSGKFDAVCLAPNDSTSSPIEFVTLDCDIDSDI
nr:MAG TPA: structural protein [Caudoviricetes sp.]